MIHPLRLQRAKLLLLEDDLHRAAVILDHLLPLGVEVSVAQSVEESLEVLSSTPLMAVLCGPKILGQDLSAFYASPLAKEKAVASLPLVLLGKSPEEPLTAEAKKTVCLPTPIDGEKLRETLDVLCKLQEEVRVLKRELEELYGVQEDLNDFVSVAAHDLRAPLSLIMGYTELIKMMPDMSKEEQGNNLNVISTASQKMATLLEELEGYSKMRDREMEVEKIDMRTLIHQVLIQLQQDVGLSASGIELEVSESVEVDAKMARQLFYEIIKNAHVHGGQGVNISIRSQILEEKRQTLVPLNHPLVVYHVEDSGCGFSVKQKELVFQPLKKLAGSSGTGLGLALARRIMLRHGGTLTCHSEEGKGSCFYATFPLAQADRLDLD
jgi:signal transduction histidine kinase